MKVNKVTGNPLVKIIAIVVILYFALFSNEHDNRSLRNRFSSENIKKSFETIAKRKEFISENLEKAKKLEASQLGNNQLENNQDNQDLTIKTNENE